MVPRKRPHTLSITLISLDGNLSRWSKRRQVCFMLSSLLPCCCVSSIGSSTVSFIHDYECGVDERGERNKVWHLKQSSPMFALLWMEVSLHFNEFEYQLALVV
ncbi:hypothetical protein HPP92_010815 [Vanilla planifolia]|uniref:Uncharacterized protein n=1 Tax=Vanilla planifolia TaxID=51239 RepID=A0A835R4G3_VANPL|nr:hypothetical protein HPP92_010815 [Vanilla planifolia]